MHTMPGPLHGSSLQTVLTSNFISSCCLFARPFFFVSPNFHTPTDMQQKRAPRSLPTPLDSSKWYFMLFFMHDYSLVPSIKRKKDNHFVCDVLRRFFCSIYVVLALIGISLSPTSKMNLFVAPVGDALIV